MPEALRVLIAEDKPTDAELVVRELRRAGFEPDWRRVDTEADYLEALAPDLDVILSDYRRCRSSTRLERLRLLRERELDIPFILVSGTIGEETAVAAMKEGANDYLLKDRLARLGTAVRQACSRDRNGASERAPKPRSADSFRPAPRSSTHWPSRMGCSSTSGRATTSRPSPATTHARLSGPRGGSTTSIPTIASGCLPLTRLPMSWITCWSSTDSQRRDYSFIWIRDEKRLLRDAAGRPSEVVGSWVDITERKLADLAFAESEAHLRLVMDAAAMGNWELELGTGKATGSAKLFELFGLDPERREPQHRGVARPRAPGRPRARALGDGDRPA